MGTLLYALMAGSLGIWCAASWATGMPGEGVAWQAIWGVVRYLSLFLAPAMAAHVALEIGARRDDKAAHLIYVLAGVTCLTFTLGLVAALAGQTGLAIIILGLGKGVSLLTSVGTLFFVIIELYPILHVASSRKEQRRASYGIILVLLFLGIGGAQLLVGVPNLMLALLSALFLIVSLVAFLRVDLLDIGLDPLVVLCLPLLTLFLVSCLRASSFGDIVFISCAILVIGWVGYLCLNGSDVSGLEQRLIERAGQGLRSVDKVQNEFVDLVAHQLRTPLGGIRASASMFASGDYGRLSKAGTQAAQMMQSAATRLLSMSDTFLDASRVELSAYESRRVPTDVVADVSSLVEELSFMAKGEGTDITQEIDPRSRSVRVDKEVFSSVLFNLLDNALKYAPGGHVDVVCTVDGQRLACTVSDSGRGMDHAATKTLFKKFVRGQQTTGSGFGLGLYIAKRLIEAAGGSISALNNGPGRGMSFRFELPIERFDGEMADA